MNQFPAEVLVRLRLHLEDEKKRLLARMGELSVQDPFTDPDRANDNAASDTEANEESNHDRVSALVDELKHHIESVEKALRRVSDGTYGFCSVCHEMIDTDRLSVLPTATLCVMHEKEVAGKKNASA